MAALLKKHQFRTLLRKMIASFKLVINLLEESQDQKKCSSKSSMPG
jgi:hypothetical protein